MLNPISINLDLSKELALKYPQTNITKRCFRNVWNLLELEYFNYEEIKIGYGYCKEEKFNFAVFHCFLIFNNFIVDTTLPESNNLYYVIDYYKYSEYLKKISLNKNDLSLNFDSELLQKKKKIAFKLLHRGILPLG